jgi:IS1 family transposase
VWIIYALCADRGEILVLTMGKRNSETVRQLMLKVKQIYIAMFCTNHWEAFAEVLP